MTVSINIYPEIEAIHQQGVALAKQGDIANARGAYSEAEADLAGIVVADSLSDQYGVGLHRARLMRDLAFLNVRQWMIEDSLPGFFIGRADYGLQASAEISERLVDEGRSNYDERSWNTLLAEHGATISLSARVALLNTVIGNFPESEIYTAIAKFEKAEEYLREGNSGYYGASNAIREAGAERLVGGGPRRIGQLFGRSLLYASTSASLRDGISAMATIGSNVRKLRSPKAVVGGTKSDP
jgi:hypothetical protein